jgi:hypothetical protein
VAACKFSPLGAVGAAQARMRNGRGRTWSHWLGKLAAPLLREGRSVAQEQAAALAAGKGTLEVRQAVAFEQRLRAKAA